MSFDTSSSKEEHVSDDSSLDREADDEMLLPGRRRRDWEGRDLAHQPSRARRVCTTLFSLRSLIDAALVVVILLLLVERNWEGGRLDVGGDVTGFYPRVSQQIVTFQPDYEFVPEKPEDFFKDSVQAKWLSIVPKGLGYISIDNPSAYTDLPTPLKEYPGNTFTTSVTHQLHCLRSVLRTSAAYAANRTDILEGDHAADGGPWHMAHCIDYLRQAIMCAGDTALEGQQTTFPPGFIGSDGWDARHVCKNYGEVKDLLEERRANDMIWI